MLFKKKPVSKYHIQKRETLESFFRFTEGKEIPAWPLEVFLEISNVCDLQCAMCTTFSALNPYRAEVVRRKKRGLMSVEEITKPLESVLIHALNVHAFGYGEPTIHPQFMEILDYLSRYEVIIDFFSNGMHLTDELCDFLVEKRISRISISFSGATNEEYENVYIGGDYERVLNGIQCLAKAKEKSKSGYPYIDINSLGFKHHVEKLPQFVEIMARHGVNNISLKPLQTYDLIPEIHQHVSVPRAHIEGAILEEAKAVARKYGVNLASKPYEATTITSDDFLVSGQADRHKGHFELNKEYVPIAQLKHISTDAKRDKQIRDEKRQKLKEHHTFSLRHPVDKVVKPSISPPCLEPFKTFYTELSGKVFPCCFKQQTTQAFGDLVNQSGAEIWKGKMFTDTQQNIIAGNYPAHLCSSCLHTKEYPKTHNIRQKVFQYSKWFKAAFGVPFHAHLQKASRTAPENQEIIDKLNQRPNQHSANCNQESPILRPKVDLGR